MAPSQEQLLAAMRRTYEAFNRGDFETALEIAHPDIEFVRPGGQAAIVGVDAMRRWMEPDAFEEMRIEPLEIRMEGTKALVRQHARAKGAGSGIELDLESWSVWTLNEDGIATRLEFFLNHEKADALEAAGLRE